MIGRFEEMPTFRACLVFGPHQDFEQTHRSLQPQVLSRQTTSRTARMLKFSPCSAHGDGLGFPTEVSWVCLNRALTERYTTNQVISLFQLLVLFWASGQITSRSEAHVSRAQKLSKLVGRHSPFAVMVEEHVYGLTCIGDHHWSHQLRHTHKVPHKSSLGRNGLEMTAVSPHENAISPDRRFCRSDVTCSRAFHRPLLK
ncbi:hypothetical protein P171DRAFT_48223 [Karstenula rhodostoma CBS 690.94]|uniref:Uncharacterized protein n=1 Tax=Karstenula rhodostoma CBS 690.94 TaxID=1392251 RepID=A0A9P4U8V3_9PLEO|nr:hypothetical protein P171DRAFT_48223 [Karstenula rhodostoma CBS 690.94]